MAHSLPHHGPVGVLTSGSAGAGKVCTSLSHQETDHGHHAWVTEPTETG